MIATLAALSPRLSVVRSDSFSENRVISLNQTIVLRPPHPCVTNFYPRAPGGGRGGGGTGVGFKKDPARY